MQLLGQIIDRIEAARELDEQRVLVVGIDGPTAAGKTTLAKALASALGEAGHPTWTFELDWTLRERSERETDVAYLKRANVTFEFEAELHMRLAVARRALESVARFNRQIQLGRADDQKIELTELYSRPNGGTATGSAEVTLTSGMVVFVEGHYSLRNELDALIDLNIVLLSEPEELLRRKVERVKGYRSPDDAIHYFWHVDLPSFAHHLRRFGLNADLVVDNTDYQRPSIVEKGAVFEWITAGADDRVGEPRRIQRVTDLPAFVFSESTLAPRELSQMLVAAVRDLLTWDQMVGRFLRVAVDEIEEDLETLAKRATEDLNRDFATSAYRLRLSHTDSFFNVYHRRLPLTLGLEIYRAEDKQTELAVLAEVDRNQLRVGVFWQGGVTWIRFERSLGGIDTSDITVVDGTPIEEPGPAPARLKVFLPTEFTQPAFLDGVDFDPVFIGREQENISAFRILDSVLREGGVWIHRFALHRDLRFFQFCLDVEGVPSLHVGNYLIAVKTSDSELRRGFKEFSAQWRTPVDRLSAMEAGRAAYDEAVEKEKADARAYVEKHCPRLAVMDGVLFGNMFDQATADSVLSEMGALLRSPYRILRKRAIEFLAALFPGFALQSQSLWTDLPDDAQQSLGLEEFTQLGSSIMAEIYLWLALRDDRSAILGANVYDIREQSLDARAFLDAAAERSCPIVLQCSLNAVGQKESDANATYEGYLRPRDGVEDFVHAVRQSARDLYLTTGTLPPLYGIGLDHVDVVNDRPPERAKRFMHRALDTGSVTHVVLDGSDLFEIKEPTRDELTRTFKRMIDWVLDLMDSPSDTFLTDMEVCISELNYIGQGAAAYVPSTADLRLFSEIYCDALVERGYASHLARPRLFVSNLGTRHHGVDDVTPWVERSMEWRDAIKGEGFVSAVLHGTTNSHPDTVAAATAGCHKVNIAGDFLEMIVDHLPERLSRTIIEAELEPKKMLPSVRSQMDDLSDTESAKVYSALKERCSGVLGTIASPRLSSMDATYFRYRSFEFTDLQTEAILDQVRRELEELMPTEAREGADRRLGHSFAASMIEVPLEEFQGSLLQLLWDQGIRHFHIDEGDGVFISRRFSGVEKARYLRTHFPEAVIHVHLMVHNPHFPKNGEFSEIQQYAEAGADAVAIHLRSCGQPNARGDWAEAVSALKIVSRYGMRPGIVLETSDSVDESLEALIVELGIDWVVAMGVPIGYGGQLFQYSTLNRVSRLHDLASRLGRDFLVECDGGLNLQNLELCRNAGGQLFSGWSILKGESMDAIRDNVEAVQAVLSVAHEA